MFQKYLRWNNIFRKFVWVIIIIGILSTLPLMISRYQVEQSANQVEFVFDYRDILEISDKYTYPQQYVDEQLIKMKNMKVTSMAVYESSLYEMKVSRQINLLSSEDMYTIDPNVEQFNENFTYLSYQNQDVQEKIEPMIIDSFLKLGVLAKPWNVNGERGLKIEMSVTEALSVTLDPNPIHLDKIKNHGFQIVIRLSNRRDFDEQEMDALLNKLHQLGVTRVVFEGIDAPGYISANNTQNLVIMGNLLNKYQMGLTHIELSKQEQKGVSLLAKNTSFNIIRLHSFTEKDNDKIAEQIKRKDVNEIIRTITDRIVLAVKDRNIRMVLINAQLYENKDTKEIINPLPVIYASLEGEIGAIARVEKLGFRLSPAEAFDLFPSLTSLRILNMLILLGVVSVVVQTLSLFAPKASLFLFIFGVLVALGLHELVNSLYPQMMALVIAICAPSLAIIITIRSIRNNHSKVSPVINSLWQLSRATMISLIGVLFVIALLNHISFLVVLQQFRGVNALHIAPMVIVGLYLLWTNEHIANTKKWKFLNRILQTPTSVMMILGFTVTVLIVNFYLSRTGNEGQASSLELIFRSYLEETLGTRPRTKEFLISHPIFIIGAYLSIKYKRTIYVITCGLIGVIGQLSIIDTFAHIHTPLTISAVRVFHGLWIGTLLGVIIIVAWELCTRGWKRWSILLK